MHMCACAYACTQRLAVYDWDLGVSAQEYDFLGSVDITFAQLLTAAESGACTAAAVYARVGAHPLLCVARHVACSAGRSDPLDNVRRGCRDAAEVG